MTQTATLDAPTRQGAVHVRLSRDRRNAESRARLLRRVRAEFSEMPGLRLTAAQFARLVGVSVEVGTRLLTSLAAEGWLRRDEDGRYGVGDRP